MKEEGEEFDPLDPLAQVKREGGTEMGGRGKRWRWGGGGEKGREVREGT